MIKLSSIYKFFIDVSTFVLLRYLLLLPNGEILGIHKMRTIIVFIAVLLFLLCVYVASRTKTMYYYRWTNKYIIIYIPAVVVSLLYTYFEYSYSIETVLYVIAPYMYILLAYPLIYIFQTDGTIFKYLKRCAIYEIVILVFKSIGWYTFNFSQRKLFTELVLEFEGWVRDGKQRVEAGQLFALAYVLVLYGAIVRSKKYLYIIAGCMFGFIVIITQFRFQMVAVLLCTFVMFYYSSEKSRKKTVIRMGLIITIFTFLISGIVSNFISSISLSGTYGDSTQVRIDNIEHYFARLSERGNFLGLGLLTEYNENAYSVMRRNQWKIYFLDDIGILGGIVRFGIGSIVVYGLLFVKMVKTCIKSFKVKYERVYVLMSGLTVYIIFSCILLNIFDMQRAYAIPFYVAIYSYMDAKLNKISEVG